MRLFLALTVFLFSFSNICTAQKVIRTLSGQGILLQANGEWSLIADLDSTKTKSLDSLVENQNIPPHLTPDLYQNANQQLDYFKNEEAISRVEIENIHSSISYLNLQIEQAKSQKNKEEVKEKKQALKNQEERLKKAEEGYNNAFKAIEQISKVLESGKRKAEKRLSKYSEISGIYLPQQENKASETPQIITKEIEYDKPYPTSFQPAKEKSKSEYTCSVIFDGKDESMGVKRKQIEPASFFAFTPPSMKPVLKSDNFLKCDVSLAKIDGDYYMLLQFRIRSKDAKKNYGFIQIGERLRITTVKGNSIYCKAVNKAEGRLEQYTGNTLYNAMYKIEKEDLGKIKKQYIDEVGVIWTSGFESYKVYNVDLLKNQMECLESKK